MIKRMTKMGLNIDITCMAYVHYFLVALKFQYLESHVRVKTSKNYNTFIFSFLLK